LKKSLARSGLLLRPGYKACCWTLDRTIRLSVTVCLGFRLFAPNNTIRKTLGWGSDGSGGGPEIRD
jgi:hypothetical protein